MLPFEPASQEIAKLLMQAFSYYRNGLLEEAIQLFNRILFIKPDNFEALHGLGITALQRGRNEEALRWIDRSLSANGDSVAAHSNRAIALARLNRREEALASYDTVLALQPDHVIALNNRGSLLMELDRAGEAVECFSRALEHKPDYIPALYNLGNALLALGRAREAVAVYDRALGIKPDLVEAYNNRGSALMKLNLLSEAKSSFEHAASLNPAYAEAYFNLGTVLKKLNRNEEAVGSFHEAVRLKPDYPEVYNNLGNAYRYLNRLEDALASYRMAAAQRPDDPLPYNNCGVALVDMHRPEEALSCYERALAIQPDFADAHWNESLCRLLMGDYERGWEEHEWRWKRSDAEPLRPFHQPQWTGQEPIAGKTILLYAEQGLGDTLQFSRYVREVAMRGADVILEVQPALKTLLKDLDGTTQVAACGEPLPEFDLHCPLMSLPLALGTRLETIPARIPYVLADPDKTQQWKDRLGPRTGLRVGLVWAGNPANRNDRNRSIRPDLLAPLLHTGAQLISLQKELRDGDAEWLQLHPQIRHYGDQLADFSETAALAHSMDMIISVDTAVAHLAGALGREVWVLVPYAPDWRWMLHRTDSPWYPTARLFRQSSPGNWRDVLAALADALRRRVAVHAPNSDRA